MIDASLARGLVNRLNREVLERFKEYSARHKPEAGRDSNKRSRRKWFLSACKDAEAFAGEMLVTVVASGKEKSPIVRYLFLMPDSRIMGRINIACITVNAKRCFRDIQSTRIGITRHCLERAFQRLNTTDPGTVLAELRGAVGGFLKKELEDPGEPLLAGADFDFPAEHGRFFGKVDDNQRLLITTYVNNEKLRPEQKRKADL